MDLGGDLEEPARALLHVDVVVVHQPDAVAEDVRQRQLEDRTAHLAPDELHDRHVRGASGPRGGGLGPAPGPWDQFQVPEEERVQQFQAHVVALRPVGHVRLQPVAAAVQQLLAQSGPGDLVQDREGEEHLLVVLGVRQQFLREEQPCRRGSVAPVPEVVSGDLDDGGVADPEGPDLVREVPLHAHREVRVGPGRKCLRQLVGGGWNIDHLVPIVSLSGWAGTGFGARSSRGLPCMTYSYSWCMSATAWTVSVERSIRFCPPSPHHRYQFLWLR